MDERWYLIIALLIAVALFLILWGLRRMRPKAADPYEDMEGRDFEFYCAELLKRRGFIGVEVTKGSGDFGIDILAEKDGITYGFQCKCYDTVVGVHAVQEAYAGRDYYDLMVAGVITNQYFTEPAVKAAKKLKIMLWDRDYIDEDYFDKE
ncbi:MAG: restriction endonuclease [Lachnospiraceae bacterium]|nr:restriction endonuclease [Lachnospiraceae bacterium]